jgi:hypothetical protein
MRRCIINFQKELVLQTGSLFIYMGAKNKTKYNSIEIGDSFGDWVVVNNVFIDRYAKVPCRCKCGVVTNVDAYTLVAGKSNGCKLCSLPRSTDKNPSWKGYEEIPLSWFNGFKRRSKREFEITIEDVWELYLKQDKKCMLTGMDISFKNTRTRGYKELGTSCTASIDRIDSSKGYILSNIQLVHKDVNIMKNAFDQSYLISLCKAVVDWNT